MKCKNCPWIITTMMAIEGCEGCRFFHEESKECILAIQSTNVKAYLWVDRHIYRQLI